MLAGCLPDPDGRRMRTILPALLLFALTACQPPAERKVEPEDPRPASPAQQPSQASIESLAGERVAGIDGQSFDEPVGLSLTGDTQQLWWEPRCAGMARSYRIEGQRIRFEPNGPPRPVGSPTAPVCSIGLPSRLDEVFRALDDATSISRSASNGVLISGPKHGVLLFSQ